MSRRYLWQQIKAELRDLAWRLTKGTRSERRIEAYRRRNARILRRAARRAADPALAARLEAAARRG